MDYSVTSYIFIAVFLFEILAPSPQTQSTLVNLNPTIKSQPNVTIHTIEAVSSQQIQNYPNAQQTFPKEIPKVNNQQINAPLQTVITPSTYSCPSILDIQKQIETMNPDQHKVWQDAKGLSWTIYMLKNSGTPPLTIERFYQANWNGNPNMFPFTMLCHYEGSVSISVMGHFNAVNPTHTPWVKVSDGEMICRDKPENCGFEVSK